MCQGVRHIVCAFRRPNRVVPRISASGVRGIIENRRAGLGHFGITPPDGALTKRIPAGASLPPAGILNAGDRQSFDSVPCILTAIANSRLPGQLAIFPLSNESDAGAP